MKWNLNTIKDKKPISKSNRKKWQHHEKDYIKQHIHTMSNAQLADKLGCEKFQVEHMAGKLMREIYN